MDDLIQRGIYAYKTGNRDEARKIFITVVKQEPNNELAWGWMFELSIDNKERIYCLQQMLRINPGNKKTREMFEKFTVQPSNTVTPSKKEITQPPKMIANKVALRPTGKTTTKNRGYILWLAAFAGIVFTVMCLWLIGIYVMSSDTQSSNTTVDSQPDEIQTYLLKLSPLIKSLYSLNEDLNDEMTLLSNNPNVFYDQNWRNRLNSTLSAFLQKANELESIEPIPAELTMLDGYLDQAASEYKQMVFNLQQYLRGDYEDATYLLKALENINNSNIYINLAVKEMNNYSNP